MSGCGLSGQDEDAGPDDGADAEQCEIDGAEDAPQRLSLIDRLLACAAGGRYGGVSP